jgi:hypothetical protein
MRLLLTLAGCFLCLYASAQKDTVHINTIEIRTGFYYDGTVQNPKPSDIGIDVKFLATQQSIPLSINSYDLQVIPEQNNTNVGDFYVYIIAKGNITFDIYGDICGDTIGVNGPNGNDLPLKFHISPRLLNYDPSMWTAYDKVYDGTNTAYVTFNPKGADMVVSSRRMGDFIAQDAPYIRIDTVKAHFTDGKNSNPCSLNITIDSVKICLMEAGAAAGNKDYLLDQYTVFHNYSDVGKSDFFYPGDWNSSRGVLQRSSAASVHHKETPDGGLMEYRRRKNIRRDKRPAPDFRRSAERYNKSG